MSSQFDRRLLRALPLCLLALSVVNCSNILGIEDASCDPAVADCQVGVSALCQEYCDTVMANCSGELSVYIGPEACLSVCGLLPEGSAGDIGVNTVQCRLGQARSAATTGEPAAHCAGAGPGGEGPPDEFPPGEAALCGTNCEGLCTLMLGACDEYSSLDACIEECRAVPDLGGYDTSTTRGNSVQCRLWHASAATREAFPHCQHAAGENTCI